MFIRVCSLSLDDPSPPLSSSTFDLNMILLFQFQGSGITGLSCLTQSLGYFLLRFHYYPFPRLSVLVTSEGNAFSELLDFLKMSQHEHRPSQKVFRWHVANKHEKVSWEKYSGPFSHPPHPVPNTILKGREVKFGELVLLQITFKSKIWLLIGCLFCFQITFPAGCQCSPGV